MSIELVDLGRLKVTEETSVILNAQARLQGRGVHEIVRGLLHEWAQYKLHEQKLTHAACTAQGLLGTSGDTAKLPQLLAVK